MNAAEILRRLRLKFAGKPGEWSTFVEVANGTGFGTNGWIDFLAIALWPSGGGRKVAVEVKVSRSDFHRELERPQKRAWAELNFTEYWFAAPKGIIPTEELPEGSGLLETWGPDGLRATRKAVQRRNEPEPEVWLAIARAADNEARAARAELDGPIAELRGRPLSVADLRRLSEKLRGRNEALREIDVRNAARELRKEAKANHREWEEKWSKVHDAVFRALGAKRGRRYHYPIRPDDALAWVEEKAAPDYLEGEAAGLAVQLRRLADKLDPPRQERESA